MGVKIIKRGIKPSEIPMRGTCSICNTVIECSKGDCSLILGVHKSETPPPFVSCPVCKGSIFPTTVDAETLERDYCFEEGNRG